MVQTPSGGAGHGAAVTDTGLLSIGAVLNVLREEFPEVTISKIRFLESEGLVEPRRTPRGTGSSAPRTSSVSAMCCACSATTTCRSR